MAHALERYKKTSGDGASATLDLETWNGVLDTVGPLLGQLVQKGADFDAVANTVLGVLLDRINAVLSPAYDQVTARGAQIEALYAQLVGTGVSAAAVIETADRLFLTADRRAAILSDLRGGVAGSGDTLAKLYGLVQARATPADIAAAIAGVQGSADAAHDTLGELAALVDANTAAVTTKADAVATATALGNRLRLDVAGGTSAAQQTIGRLNLNAASNDDLRAIGRFLAKLTGTVIQTGGLMIDEFVDLTGVDTANSTNVNLDATNKLVSNQFSETSSSYPAMTGNDAPSGYAARSSGLVSGSGAAWQAFDRSPGYNSASEVITSGLPGWVFLSFPAGQRFTAYKIANRPGGVAMTSWLLQGSNDGGSTFTTVDSRSGYSFSGATYDTFQIASPGTYTTYRLYVTANQANNAAYIPDVQFLKSGSGAMALKSIVAPWSGSGSPSKASIFLAAKVISGTLDLNNNLIAKATRGGGAYATFVLQQLLTLGGWTFLKADGLDLSGLTAGASPAYEIDVAASLGLQLDTAEFGYGS